MSESTLLGQRSKALRLLAVMRHSIHISPEIQLICLRLLTDTTRHDTKCHRHKLTKLSDIIKPGRSATYVTAPSGDQDTWTRRCRCRVDPEFAARTAQDVPDQKWTETCQKTIFLFFSFSRIRNDEHSQAIHRWLEGLPIQA